MPKLMNEIANVSQEKDSPAAGSGKSDAGKAAHLKQTHDYAALRDSISDKLERLLSKESSYLSDWEQKRFIRAGMASWPNSGSDDVECKIAVVAPVSAGKSTLFNAICEYPILPVASKVTSAVPTYITRAKDHSGEAVAVCPLNKVYNPNEKGEKNIKYVRDEKNKKTYAASDISLGLFKELLAYMRLVMRGNGIQFDIIIENIAYFMSSTEAVDIEFFGDSPSRMSLSDDAYGLSYENPRHRLLLLLILVCVYVNQNEENENSSEYRKEVNAKRVSLMKKCGFPAESDYCVDLTWCSSSLPEGVTLIDLPGTGSDTKEKGRQSSHTQLVKGILFDADAMWVLASVDGTVQFDLGDALADAKAADPTKNVVCIYNCKDGRYKDATTVSEFLKKFPFLVGERCFVVDAMAGEYKYLQNGIKAENTWIAAKKRNEWENAEAEKIIQILREKYSDTKRAMPTYMSRLENGAIIVRQELEISYTLETFFKDVLTDYIARLKYELILKKAIGQLTFFGRIKAELDNTLKLLTGINGRGPEIAGAVNNAMRLAYDNAVTNYTKYMIEKQKKLAGELAALNSQLSPLLGNAFAADYQSLVGKMHEEWKTLTTPGHDNTLETNFFGNYSLKSEHSNWVKFSNVRDKVDGMISFAAFKQALGEADRGIAGFRALLEDYVNGLKKLTQDFCNDYMKAFSDEYHAQRDQICLDDGRIINETLWDNFVAAETQLQDAISGKLANLCTELCTGFEALVEQGGLFDKVKEKTNKGFKKRLSDIVLDGLREGVKRKYAATNKVGFIVDKLDQKKFEALLLDDFKDLEDACKKSLRNIVDAIYGNNLRSGESTVNFPQDLSATVNDFNATILKKQVREKIGQTSQNIMDLVSFGVGVASNVNAQIAEARTAISNWDAFGSVFSDIGVYLFDGEGGTINKLTEEYRNLLKKSTASATTAE